MRPQGSINPAGRMINLLQWLNFPIFPMLPQLPFNFMNFHGNEGALGAAVSPAMFMPSNLMHVQSAPAQVHQQPALGVESELNRTQEYPVSLKLAFCKWKEGFKFCRAKKNQNEKIQTSHLGPRQMCSAQSQFKVHNQNF